ncbi:MAG: ATP-dependent DNA helicase RecG [Actinomycetes bacterium]
MADLNTKLTAVLGDRTAKALANGFGMSIVGDLLRHYPRRYAVRGELSDISALAEGDEVTVLAEISAVRQWRVKGRTILEATVTDGSSSLYISFFNQVWREKELHVGRTGLFAGKIGLFNGKRQLSHPDYQLIPDGNDVDAAISEFAGKYLPVYPATSKLPSWKLSQCLALTLDSLAEIPDYLPNEIAESLHYPSLQEAFRNIHQPTDLAVADRARERLTFDEALLLQLVLAQRRAEISELPATPRVQRDGGLLARLDAALPFTLTQGQIEVAAEINFDMRKPHPMHRLLQGEVGSGKTIISLRAMLAVVDSGGQAALLAPTEVLAAQHAKTFRALLGPMGRAGTLDGDNDGTQITLLTGSLSAVARRNALESIATGQAGIVIGTHALLSEGVEFFDLGLIVIDEQHRFGVEQRDSLRMKAKLPPHLLVMTATPIPRTVAMTIFGDLDISTLRQLPSGRSPIRTHVVSVIAKPHFLDRAWTRVREEVAKGHQVYVVAPRISSQESENTTKISDRDRAMAVLMGDLVGDELEKSTEKMTAVEDLAPELATGALKGLKVAVVHGRLPSDEKDATMDAFSSGEIDVLVATTVIEVGMDVPNASMMVIMDADRFGVSQLHQMRGRVGRGTVPGLCLLVSQAPENSPAMARLEAVASTLDGFELSRIDLDQRREGDVLGKAQSGTRSHLRLLRVLRDEALIERSREVARTMISQDPALARWPQLANEVAQLKIEEKATFLDKG